MSNIKKDKKRKTIKKLSTRGKKMMLLGFYQFQDPYYQGFAAQTAFYMFLSVIPTVIVLSQLLGLFSIDISQVRDWIGLKISGEGMDALEGMLSYRPSSANNVFLIIVALWAASRTQFSLMRIVNYTFTDGESTGRGYLKDRVRSLLTTIGLLATIVLALAILVYIPLLPDLIIKNSSVSGIVDSIWKFFKWPAIIAGYFFTISFLYYLLPTNRVRFSEIIPGSVFASIGFLIVTVIYTVYTRMSVANAAIYGSLASIVALMFWFWFISWVLLLGVTLNRMWWATRPKNEIPIAREATERREAFKSFNL